MNLRIVTQRLEVADADHRGSDRLPVADSAAAKGHFHAKPLLDQALENLQLYLSHQLHMDFPSPLVPEKVQLGIFFLQLPQTAQGCIGVRTVGQPYLISQNWLQYWPLPIGFKAQPVSRAGMAQPGYGTDSARRSLLHRVELGAGVYPQLVCFFRPGTLLRIVRALVGQ